MILYRIGILLMGLVMRVAALFDAKARRWVDGRRGIFGKMESMINPSDRIFWMHCASLGEFEQGRPVLEAVRREYPEYKILLTFFSPSGYEVRKNYGGADFVFYLPLDTPRNVRRFLRAAHPEIAVIVKYEFWLDYLRGLSAAGVRTFIISAIFRRDSVFFRWYGGIFRRALSVFEKIFVQDDNSKKLLAELGVDRVVVAGDTRFDRVAEIAAAARDLPLIEWFAAGSKVFIAGSTWPPDDEIVMRLAAAWPIVKFIIVPHEVTEAHVQQIVSLAPGAAVRYTQIDNRTDLAGAQVLVIDTIGLLSSAYRYAGFAYIGGGFGVGIHNILEAATYGLPVAFGPNYAKFREAREMIAAGAARSVSDFAQLEQWFSQLLEDEALYERTRAASAAYVASNRGATARIMAEIFPR